MVKKVKIPEPFRADPEDDVKVISAVDALIKGPLNPKIHTVKRKQLEELRSRGWIYLPDYYRLKYREEQNLLKEYKKMFVYLRENN